MKCGQCGHAREDHGASTGVCFVLHGNRYCSCPRFKPVVSMGTIPLVDVIEIQREMERRYPGK